ncbi:nucleotidyltransferase family protein [Altericroceibacterium xinjiangense]|uniref:nucleotidyltransferase family protein n=1 Tax=Altericroceibacterium xinjiangense TaxID=762261 RepID=UPI000F7DEF01|nr:nucleotidyltransferase family protein [Altericroceibacterium xinjiangense]
MAPLLTIMLAAGQARRFGGGKLDAMCGGRRVGEWVIDAVAQSGLPAGMAVTGPDAPQFLVAHPEWQRIVNPAPEAGLGSSLSLAARAAIANRAEGMLVLLADMPLLDPEFLRKVSESPAPAATRYPGGGPGVPALIPRRLFPELAILDGERGAAPVLAADPALVLLDAPDPMLIDIDRPVDLVRAEAAITARSGKMSGLAT